MKTLPICNGCQDESKSSLSKIRGEGWLCDDCIADNEHYDKHCEEYEERKRQRIAESNEY